MCKSNGHPKRASSFICLSCGKIIMEGIQRPKQQEYLHIKDLYCAFENKDVKAVEIRWCDDKDEIIQHISELKREYNYEYESEEINYADKRLCD